MSKQNHFHSVLTVAAITTAAPIVTAFAHTDGSARELTAARQMPAAVTEDERVNAIAQEGINTLKVGDASLTMQKSGEIRTPKRTLLADDVGSRPDESTSPRLLAQIPAERADTSSAAPVRKPTRGESNDSNREKLEEVVVTAQKREEKLQDVPISLSVLSGSDLDESNVGVTEWLNRVPGVSTLVAVQGGGTQLGVRGVTASGPTFSGASPIAYYIDSVPFGLVKTAVVPDANAYDLERIEVLRGPQGTLYGASALNGVVRVLTKDADPDQFGLKVRTSGSRTDMGGDNYRGDLMINTPIVAGKLGARAVIGYEHLSGWIDKPNEKDANDGRLRSARLKVDGKPTDEFSIGLSAWIARQDYGALSRSISLNDEQTSTAAIEEPIETDYDAYGLNMSYDFSAFTISSMTSYLEYSNHSLFSAAPYGSTSTLGLITNFDADVVSQEIILNSAQAGGWRWSVGGMYRDGSDVLFSNLNAPIIPAPVYYTLRSKSYAIFGELTRLFLDGRLEVTAGIRHFEDDVKQTEHVQLSGNPADPLIRVSERFDADSPRVVVSWHANDRLTVYGSYAEGFRSGYPQNTGVLRTAPDFAPVQADTLKNYELGAKGDLFGGRLYYESAVYYIDWQDVLQTVSVPFFSTFIAATLNGASASGPGAEVSITTRPMEGFDFGMNFSWNDLTMDDVVLSRNIPLFAKGDRLNSSPEYTAGAFTGYSFRLGGGGSEMRLSAAANYISEQCSAILGSAPICGDSTLVARASFAVDFSGGWAASLYVDNATNEDGMPLAGLNGIASSGIRIRPRTVGLQIEYRFQ